jgi:hypothetical protein
MDNGLFRYGLDRNKSSTAFVKRDLRVPAPCTCRHLKASKDGTNSGVLRTLIFSTVIFGEPAYPLEERPLYLIHPIL